MAYVPPVPVASVVDTTLGRVVAVGVLCVLVFALLAARFELLHAATSSDTAPPTTNCPSCGARTKENRDTCEYCGEPLEV